MAPPGEAESGNEQPKRHAVRNPARKRERGALGDRRERECAKLLGPAHEGCQPARNAIPGEDADRADSNERRNDETEWRSGARYRQGDEGHGRADAHGLDRESRCSRRPRLHAGALCQHDQPGDTPHFAGDVTPEVDEQPDPGCATVRESLSPPRQDPAPRLNLDRVRRQHGEDREGDPARLWGQCNVERRELPPVGSERAPHHRHHDARNDELREPHEPAVPVSHGVTFPTPSDKSLRTVRLQRRDRDGAARQLRPRRQDDGSRRFRRGRQ